MSFYEGITPIESYDLGMGLEPEKKILFLGGDWFLQLENDHRADWNISIFNTENHLH